LQAAADLYAPTDDLPIFLFCTAVNVLSLPGHSIKGARIAEEESAISREATAYLGTFTNDEWSKWPLVASFFRRE
jgi:hypothetical protein